MLRSNTDQTNFLPTGRKNSWRQRQQGQALIEFALVLLFIILPITFVLVDGALMLFTLANVTNAAREAARAGSIYQSGTVNPTLSFSDQMAAVDLARKNCLKTNLGVTGLSTTCQADPYGRLRNLVDVNSCNITASYPVTATNVYRELDPLSVKVECPHRLLFGLVGAGSITLTAQSTMKIEPGGASPQ